jgi:hypothetical protein
MDKQAWLVDTVPLLLQMGRLLEMKKKSSRYKVIVSA